MPIGDMFERSIQRSINGVIKADQRTTPTSGRSSTNTSSPKSWMATCAASSSAISLPWITPLRPAAMWGLGLRLLRQR